MTHKYFRLRKIFWFFSIVRPPLPFLAVTDLTLYSPLADEVSLGIRVYPFVDFNDVAKSLLERAECVPALFGTPYFVDSP